MESETMMNSPLTKKKRLGGGTQPKEDKMKKLVLLNSGYQNSGEIEIRRVMYFTIERVVFLQPGT
jgi:hypothetical protein